MATGEEIRETEVGGQVRQAVQCFEGHTHLHGHTRYTCPSSALVSLANICFWELILPLAAQ